MNIVELNTLEKEIHSKSCITSLECQILDAIYIARKFFILRDEIWRLQDKINNKDIKEYPFYEIEDAIFDLNNIIGSKNF